MLGTYNNTTTHDQCIWESAQKLTLTEVSGQGTCLGKVPKTHSHLCNETQATVGGEDHRFLIPPPQGWWACNTGLTPCISTSVFNASKDFCILVQLVPRLTYHDGASFTNEFDHQSKTKREPVSMTLALLLGIGIAAGATGAGTVAMTLVQGA